MVYTWLKNSKPDVSMCLNASLAGLVGITAGCDALDAIGADSLGYLSLEHAKAFAPEGQVCLACFGGGYPTAAPAHGEKARFEGKIKG